MGQTLSTLGGIVGYKHEYITKANGDIESLVTVVDASLFRRKIKLQFTIEDERREGERHPDEPISVTAGEAEEERVIPAVIQASADKHPMHVAYQEDDGEDQELSLPPISFVDEEEAIYVDNTSGLNNPSSSQMITARRPRQVQSTGVFATEKDETSSFIHSRHRPKSVGPCSGEGAARVFLKTLSDTVAIIGLNGLQQAEMNRVRLTLRDQEATILIPVLPSAVEGDKEMPTWESEEVGYETSQGKEKGDERRRPRRCQSVTLSLETEEPVSDPAKAGGTAGQDEAEKEEGRLSVEVEQIQGFRPLRQVTSDIAASMTTVTTNAELEAAVLRLCQAYTKDDASPTVISHKRDIRLITGFLSRILLPRIERTEEDGLPAFRSGKNLVSDYLPSEMDFLSPREYFRPRSPSSLSSDSSTHTLIPLPPLSPYAHEPIIEKSSNGRAPATLTAGVNSTGALPVSDFANKSKVPPLVETHAESAPKNKAVQNSPSAPPKPRKTRKIRLSASSVEEVDTSKDEGGALFDDLWDMRSYSSNTASTIASSTPSSRLRTCKASPVRVARRKYILPPEEDEERKDISHEMIPDDEGLW